MRTAVEHIDATVALVEGPSWLDRTGRLAGAEGIAVALGVVSLAQPMLVWTWPGTASGT
jgi:hypothetical protein